MKVNARNVELKESLPLLSFLRREGYNASHVALELNGEVVPRSRFADIDLVDGDAVEIVCFVGGGI